MAGSRNLWQVIGRAPLAWLFLPFLAGLILARHWPGVGTAWVVPGVLAAFGLAWWQASRPGWWFAAFGVAALALGGWWGARFLPPPPEPWVAEPLRERMVEVRAERLFQNDPSGRVAGLGRVVSVVPDLRRNDLTDKLIHVRTMAGEAWREGAVYQVYGVLRPLGEDPAGWGEFDGYLAGQGVVAGLDGQKVAQWNGEGRWWQVVFADLRQQAKQSLSRGAAGQEDLARVYRAMLLGERLDLTPAQKSNFRMTGTAHLFAISGLHVGIIAGILFGLLNLLRLGEVTRLLAGMLLLGFYVLLTGAPPSAQRAYLMVLCLWGGRVWQRGYAGGSALFASAFLVTLIDPRQPFSLGFKLSYAVVFAILVYGIPLAEALKNWLQPDPYSLQPEGRIRPLVRSLAMSFAISFGAFLGSAPLMIWYFEILPLSAVFLNVPLLPLAGLLLALGVLSVAAGFLGLDGISWLLNHGAWPVIDAMQSIIGLWLAWLPGHSVMAFRSETAGAMVVAGLLAAGIGFSCQREISRWLLVGIPVGLVLAIWWAT